MMRCVVGLLLGLLLVVVKTVAGLSVEQGYPRVVDGDTVVLNGKNIRLQGIDAPETRQTCNDRYGSVYQCGVVSTNKLKWKIGKRPVICSLEDEKDYYGRYIGYFSLSSPMDVAKSLNAWMVYWGYAVSYRYYSTEFVPQEDRAKLLRRGLWSGTFEMPWDWRKNN